MTYCDTWDSFEKQATSIYTNAPSATRYTIKYRNCDAALVLKVTDDATCVKLRTERLGDIKKIAHLHRLLAQTASQRTTPIKELAPIFPEQENIPAAAPEQKQASGQGKKKGRGKKRI
ncbi:hypothetical protein GGI07_002144 [Coemansia sp. Benny D115]|nr:hypothetical protein GGI07_002144 [Coemansia sp. Benny D115]